MLPLTSRLLRIGRRPFSTSISSIHDSASTLSLGWSDSLRSTFHKIWLRDHCRCVRCVDPSTQQKLHSSADVLKKFDTTTVDIQREADDVVLKWSDGHTSRFPSEFLRTNCTEISSRQNETNLVPNAVYWSKENLPAIPRHKYQDLISNEADIYKWLQDLNKYGVSLVTGVPTNEGQIREITGMITPKPRRTIYGDIWDVKAVTSAINLAYTTVGIPLHQDLMYYECPPGFQFLHCLKFHSGVVGGGSIMVDGCKVAAVLRDKNPSAFKLLSTVNLTHHYDNNNHHMVQDRPAILVDKFGEIKSVSVSPPWIGILKIPQDIVEDYYKALSELMEISIQPDMCHTFRMQEGDLIAFNNRRIWHGREEYTEVDTGMRHLQGSYVDADDFLDRYRYLRRRYDH